MAMIYVSLYGYGGAPRVNVLRLPSGESCINAWPSDDLCVTLFGYDHAAVKEAYALADAIRGAAKSLETRLLRKEDEKPEEVSL